MLFRPPLRNLTGRAYVAKEIAEEFAAILQRVPGGTARRDWPAVARCLWQLEEGYADLG
jgi:hypothetical protein